jgi:hypothetical protein
MDIGQSFADGLNRPLAESSTLTAPSIISFTISAARWFGVFTNPDTCPMGLNLNDLAKE